MELICPIFFIWMASLGPVVNYHFIVDGIIVSQAEWCAPCRQIAPLLEELASELGETLEIAKIDVDSNPATPGKYGVRGIPTLILFKNGEVAATKVGALPKTKLYQWVQSSI